MTISPTEGRLSQGRREVITLEMCLQKDNKMQAQLNHTLLSSKNQVVLFLGGEGQVVRGGE